LLTLEQRSSASLNAAHTTKNQILVKEKNESPTTQNRKKSTDKTPCILKSVACVNLVKLLKIKGKVGNVTIMPTIKNECDPTDSKGWQVELFQLFFICEIVKRQQIKEQFNSVSSSAIKELTRLKRKNSLSLFAGTFPLARVPSCKKYISLKKQLVQYPRQIELANYMLKNLDSRNMKS